MCLNQKASSAPITSTRDYVLAIGAFLFMRYNQKLVFDTKEYFEKKFSRSLNDEETDVYLNRLADLGAIFISNYQNMRRNENDNRKDVSNY